MIRPKEQQPKLVGSGEGVVGQSEFECPSLFVPFVETMDGQVGGKREYWLELERKYIELLRALSEEFGDKGLFRLCLTGSGARRAAANSRRYSDTREYFRQMWWSSDLARYDEDEANATATQKRAAHAVRGCLHEDYDFVLILHDNSLISQAREVAGRVLSQPTLFEFSQGCVPTNTAVPIFRFETKEGNAGFDIHMFMLTVWGEEPLRLLDNRLGDKVPLMSQHTATLVIYQDKLVFLKQELERIEAKLDTPDYIRYQPNVDPFTQFELFLRMVRMKYMHNPMMPIEQSIWLRDCDQEIYQILSAVSVKLSWLYTHPEKLEDPVIMEQFCLFLRELLVMKHIGALPELFLNGESGTGVVMKEVINMLVIVQKGEVLAEKQNELSYGVLMHWNEQAFAQWLLGVPWESV